MLCRVSFKAIFLLSSFAATSLFAQERNEPEEEIHRPGVVSLDKGRFFAILADDLYREPPLVREIARQAFLIAAREELGQITRDAWLGESLNVGDPKRVFEVSCAPGTPSLTEVLQGVYPTQTVIWTYRQEFESKTIDYLAYLEQMEQFSRKDFVELLKRQCAIAAHDSSNANAKLSGEVLEQLGSLDLLAQFEAIRKIHALMRRGGQSQELLGGLTRGYAHVGLQTDFFWHPVSHACAARSLLYAQRMVVHEPKSPMSFAHRAYAFALAGFHANALKDLDQARELNKAAGIEFPEWVALIEAYCKCDWAPLEDHAARSPLAALLLFLAVEHEGTRPAIILAGEHVLESHEAIYRVYDGLARFGGLGIGGRSSRQAELKLRETVYESIQSLDDLPQDVRELLDTASAVGRGLLGLFGGGDDEAAENRRLAAFIAALRTADEQMRFQDEFSLKVLATLVEELSFAQAWRRVQYLQSVLATESGDSIAQLEPLLRNHPFWSYLASNGAGTDRKRLLTQQATNLDFDRLTLSSRLMAATLYNLIGDAQAQEAWNAAAIKLDDRVGDLKEAVSFFQDKNQALSVLRKVSPHSPFAIAQTIEHNWDAAKKHREWEQTADRFPSVAAAFGRRFAVLKEYDKAEKFLKLAIETAPTVEAHIALADLYRQQGQLDRWQATLEDFLEEPAFGLDHARVQQALVNHFIVQREWEKALPYAEDAAVTGAGWAMQSLANVYEGLQRFEECEEITQAIGERYPISEYRWYLFCKRTGKGDIQAAREVAFRYGSVKNGLVEFDAIPTILELDGKLQHAFELTEREFQQTKDPYYGLAAALLADRLGKLEKRDGLLKQVTKEGHQHKRPTTRSIRRELIELGEIMATDLASGGKGQIDFQRAETIRNQADAGEQMNFNYYLARYLDNRGQKEKATEHWKQVMFYAESMSEPNRTLAGAALIERGVMPEDYREELQTPVKPVAEE